MTLLLTFLLAFCSIVYELQLGQALSAFLGNTVLRYSVTIGLYMASMGLGAWLVRGWIAARPVTTLQGVELILSALGASSLFILFYGDYLLPNSNFLFALAHLLIVAIGVLSGMEIPLLFAIRRSEQKESERSVLGFDYFGAFLGTVLFAFIFYPRLGLIATSFWVALLNAVVGLLLVRYRGLAMKENVALAKLFVPAQGAIAILIVWGLVNQVEINTTFSFWFAGG